MARQPILDRDGRIYAYELLYRSASGGSPEGLDSAGENQALLNALVEIGLERLVGEKLAFFNLSRRMLESAGTSLLPAKKVVIEILEDTVLEPTVKSKIDQLRGAGYPVAYDDFTFQPHQMPFAACVDLIKVDVMGLPWKEIAKGVPFLKSRGIVLLAEKVETREMYEQCKAIGFDLFQGYFFSKPETLSSTGADTTQKAVLSLLNELNQPQVTATKLEAAIALDPVLAARLLRLVNCASFGASQRIDSIRIAIQLLGIARLQAFATVLAATRTTTGTSRALGDLGLIRARLCEKIACSFGDPEPHKYFTIGLLSVLDALMGLPMTEIVSQLSLSAEVSQALLSNTGPGAMVLHMAKAFEAGKWKTLAKAKLDRGALQETYLSAVADAAALSSV